MPFETIGLEPARRGIATIVLDRPDRGNALDRTMLAELAHSFDALAADDAARLVVLRGAGRHFCSGADLGDGADRDRTDRDRADAPVVTLLDMLAALDGLAKPTIAAVQGAAIGAGAAIAACCDIVVAGEGAFFSIPEVRIGMAPVRLAPLFIRAIGHRAFRRYGISGERIDASEALRIGLAHQLCPSEVLDTVVANIADAVLHGAPGAIAVLKSACAGLAQPPWRRPSEPAEPAAAKSAEAIEGIASFREKRKPSWYPK